MPIHAPDAGDATERSLWRAINARPSGHERLTGTGDADVVVVGGGVAGLSAAIHLRQAGIDVVVIDAMAANTDGACASAGIVAPQFVRNTPATVIAKFGRDNGEALLDMVAGSGRYLFDFVRDQGIDCAARQDGFLAPAAGRKRIDMLARTVAEWRPWRTDLRLLDAGDTHALSGCIGYDGALLDPMGGGLDPVLLVDGMDRAAIAAGARIYRGSRVTAVTRQGKRWTVRTSGGVCHARRVLLCANGGNVDLHPALRGTVLPLPVCEVATGPLPGDMRATILPHGHTLTDISTDVLSLRLDRDGRLVTALSAYPRRDRADIEREVQARLEAVLPGYRATPLEFVWQGTAWLNSNLLPRCVLLDEGLVAVQACNGRGLANNLMIGRELARWLHRPDHRLMIPLERPRRVPGFTLLRHIPRLMMTGSGLMRRMAGRRSRGTHGKGDAA